MTASARPPAAVALVLVGVLAGCGLWQPGSSSSPQPDATFVIPDAATITVRSVQAGCCYPGGALYFAHLDGPTNRQWEPDDGSGDALSANSRLLGAQTIKLAPGAYTLTLWVRPCGSTCDDLLSEVARCSVQFEAGVNAVLSAEATFRMGDGCTVRMGGP